MDDPISFPQTPSEHFDKQQTTAAIIDLLARTWPKVFSLYGAHRRPLAVGIHALLLEELEGAVTPAALRRALPSIAATQAISARSRRKAQCASGSMASLAHS
jgi:sRNA-binding protein